MFDEKVSAYDIGALDRVSRRCRAEEVAEQLAPTPREGSIYDLSYVAGVTRARNEQQEIVRRLTGMR